MVHSQCILTCFMYICPLCTVCSAGTCGVQSEAQGRGHSGDQTTSLPSGRWASAVLSEWKALAWDWPGAEQALQFTQSSYLLPKWQLKMLQQCTRCIIRGKGEHDGSAVQIQTSPLLWQWLYSAHVLVQWQPELASAQWQCWAAPIGWTTLLTACAESIDSTTTS